MKKAVFVWCLVVALVATLGFVAQAGAVEKQVVVKPGWNLLNLPIEPQNKAPAQLLSGLNYATVWSWNAQNSKWRVYLSNGSEATQNYASGKGFDVLTEIGAGEGFWVNCQESSQKTIAISGSAPSNDQHNLVAGWNLIGLKNDESATVSQILNIFTQSGVNAKSLWSWDAANSKWNVYIPSFKEADLQSYANSKGFNVLSTIQSTDGFWVNASTSGSVTETPPEVGKAFKATDKNTYVPLANADVYVNGTKVGTTDSNGNFVLPDNLNPSDVITIGSGDQFTISASEVKGGTVYLLAQDQDKNKVLLETTGGSQKPTPKQICSGDGKACITISNLKLTKDITVAVTPYKTAISPPNVSKIKALDPNYMVVAGADVSFVDSNGNNISISEAGFGGKVIPKAKNFLGEFTGDVLYNYLSNIDPQYASLWLLAYVDGAYTVVGKAELYEETSQNKPNDDQSATPGAKTYYIAPATGVNIIDKLVPFVFVFKQDYLVGEIEVTVTNKGILYKSASGETLVTEGTKGKGAVVDESYGDPVKGAFVTTDNSDEYSITDANGKAKVKYILPPSNPNLGIIVKKDGYFDGTASVNVLDEGSKALAIAELPDTAAVGGVVYDSTKGKTQGGIAGAKVTLKNPIVLDKIFDDGETITVGLDEKATYKWEVRKQGNDSWLTVDEGLAHYTLTKTQIKKKLIDDFANLSQEDKNKLGANPIGTYDVRITVTHPFSNFTYVESAEGYLDITVDMAKWKETASLSEGQIGKVSVFGGKDLGFYFATATVSPSQTYTWTVSINSWDDANGNGQLEDGEVTTLATSEPVPVPFFPFIEAINLVQKNYLKLLVPPEGGWQDPAVDDDKTYLEEGVSIKVLFEISYLFVNEMKYNSSYAEFDLIIEEGQNPLDTLAVGKLQIIPNTTMAFEESQTTKEDGSYLFAFVDPALDGLLGIYANAIAYYPNSIFLGTQYPLLKGWITEVDIPLDPVELPPQPGAEPEPIPVTQAMALEWVETWEAGTELSNPYQISTTNGVWTVEGNALNSVQWWLLANPENMGPAAVPGIDYPVPEDVPSAQPYLLPAFEGSKVAWFGSKTTFTFSDSVNNTSNGKKEGKLVSPEIDLTAFSFATLEFATWWEVESVDVAKWQFDQMKVQVTVTDITETKDVGGITFALGEWKTIAWMNPDNEVPIQNAVINYSSGGNDAVPIWVKVVANLNPFAGHKIKIRFYFDSVDSLFNGFRGWAVDEIKIKNEDSGLPVTTWGDYWWWKPGIRSE